MKKRPPPPKIKRVLIQVDHPFTFQSRPDDDVGLSRSILYPKMHMFHEGGDYASACWCEPDLILVDEENEIYFVKHHYIKH